jgi:HAD superfamily hydrolase (TIGR01509 family)
MTTAPARPRRTRGIIFDLDGTLVDSRLDFAAMRRDLGLPARTPILEALATVTDPAERARLDAIVLRHELEGAERATLMPGVDRLWSEIARRDLRTAIFTRNARAVTEHTLARVGLTVDLIVAREDAPPKPDPAGLHAICAAWSLAAEEVIFVGDYLYDLDAGRNAGIRTILFTPEPPDFEHEADATIAAMLTLIEHLA